MRRGSLAVLDAGRATLLTEEIDRMKACVTYGELRDADPFQEASGRHGPGLKIVP